MESTHSNYVKAAINIGGIACRLPQARNVLVG